MQSGLESDHELEKDFPAALPPEVWNCILRRVNDPRVLLTCSRTCTSWAELLANDKPTLLFELTLTHIAAYLKRSDLLVCRLVSKKWKKIIDSFLHQSVSIATHEDSFLDPYGIHTRFFHRGKIEEFLKHLDNHSGNPFPSRCVQLSFYGEYNWLSCSKLLEKFGKHIWTLVYNCVSTPLDNPFSPLVLQLVPNVRNLWLKQIPSPWGIQGLAQQPTKVTNVPHLPHLRLLRITGREECNVAKRLLEAHSSQLQRLQCDSEAAFSQKGQCLTFSRLRILVLNICSGTTSISEALSRFSGWHLPTLEQLTIMLPNKPLEKIPPSLLQSVLLRFSKSLQELTLEVDCDSTNQNQFHPPASADAILVDPLDQLDTLKNGEFPQLHTLRIDCSFIGSNFLEELLTQLPFLEKLVLLGYWPHSVPLGLVGEWSDDEDFPSSSPNSDGMSDLKRDIEGYWELAANIQELSVLSLYSNRCEYYCTREFHERNPVIP